MDQTFKTYKRVAECYHGKATNASELALEAKATSSKHWVKVRPSSKCQEGNIRREREVDGKIITEELKDDGKYDDVATAKLMLTFEPYIRAKANKLRKSYPPEDIMFQANLALRWALEGYQPEMLSTRYRINEETGKREKYKVLTKVKFEQVWKVIFESNIQGMFQDSNRLNRKASYNSESLDRLEEEDNFQICDDSMDLQNLEYINIEGIGLVKQKDAILQALNTELEDYKNNKNVMAYLILDSYLHNYIKSEKGYKRIENGAIIPEGYTEENITRNSIIKRYKNIFLNYMKRANGNVDFFEIKTNENGKRIINRKNVVLKKKYWEYTKTERLNQLFDDAFEDIKERVTKIFLLYSPESLEDRTDISWLLHPEQERIYEKEQRERIKNAEKQCEECQLAMWKYTS